MSDQFKFRLTFYARLTSAFNAAAPDAFVHLPGNRTLRLVPRDADSLAEATAFHIEGAGYDGEDLARADAEKVRMRLRMLNALLGLGLMVPEVDSPGGQWGSEPKARAEAEGLQLVDSVNGVLVMQDDNTHVEGVVSVRATNTPSNPLYVFEAVARLLAEPFNFDSASETALSILGAAQREPSDRAAVLVTFLALETLIPRQRRSANARTLLQTLVDTVCQSGLAAAERDALAKAIGGLQTEGSTAALRRFAASVQTTLLFADRPPVPFINVHRGTERCCARGRTGVRNRSPHTHRCSQDFHLPGHLVTDTATSAVRDRSPISSHHP